MIPPISPDVLSSNPQFASLHETLTTKYLDRDASTRSTNLTHQAVEEQAQKYLTATAKENILAQALQDVALSDGENALPEELRELVYIISTYLITAPPLTPAHSELLSLEIERLHERLPLISTLISQTIQAQHTHLHSLAKAPSTTTKHHTSAPDQLSRYSLQVHLKDSLASLSGLQHATIPRTLTTLVDTLTTLLSLHAQHLALQLTHLSRHTHGTLARHTQARARHLDTVAQALAAKIQVLAREARRATYAAPTQAALARYAAHLDRLAAARDARTRTLAQELRLYAEADGRDGRTLEELGRRYGDVLAEIAEVKSDVDRLAREKGATGERR